MKEFTVQRTLKGLLAFQVVIGGLLVLGDLGGAWPRLPGLGTDAPAMDQPVRPGDQRRVYDPTRITLPGDPAQRENMPSTGDLPKRLSFLPDGDVLRLTGAIAVGDGERFADYLRGVREVPERVVLMSPGGSVHDALEIGRALRGAAMVTEVEAGGVCFSACPYVFAAGTERIAPTGARIGVHQHYFGESTVLPAFMAVEDVQRGQGQVMAYLLEMGVDPAVMQHALTTPPDEIYVLLPEELDAYGLRTDG